MILEKLHRAINNFNKTFNWRRFRRDALHLGESLLVFGVLYGIIYKSITVDNGSEFALADQLEQSCITGDKRTKVYYCHPYSSWERGSNENVNGMIRRRHPKGTDFSKVTAEEIAATENWINSYPRKIFSYKSAGTMFRECLRELGLTA